MTTAGRQQAAGRPDITRDTVREWQAAIGRSERRQELLEAESLRRYALAIGEDGEIEKSLPTLAHWAFFLPSASDSETGIDGHPRRGAFMPAIPLPRRMFAAARIAFEAPLELGSDAELISTVASVIHKAGRSGDLVFVDLDRVLSQAGIVRVRERQSYVYRDAGGPLPLPVPNDTPGPGELWNPDPVNLFRFSAATFNAHRIHYDLPYATKEEGYPALVVHGPFTAARLARLAGRSGRLASFEFRAQAPLFEGQPTRLTGAEQSFAAVRCDGEVAMTARVEYAATALSDRNRMP